MWEGYQMSKKAAEWLLAGVIFARSTSLLFAKVGLESMSPLNLLVWPLRCCASSSGRSCAM